MPEVFMCNYCRDVIDPERDQYVIPNKASTVNRDLWIYAHINCYQAAVRPSTQQTRQPRGA